MALAAAAAAAVVTLVLGLAVADDVEMVFLKSAVAKGAGILSASVRVWALLHCSLC